MEPYFFHGFRDYNVDTVCRVLESGFILPRRLLNNSITDKNNIFNGDAWISLSQKSLIDTYSRYRFRNSYDEWIFNHLCVVISPEIDGINYTNYVDYDECYKAWRENAVFDENPNRYSYFIDEIQTNFPIPVEKFLAVGYPVGYFETVKGKECVERDLDKIYNSISKNGFNIPLVDSSIYDFADNELQILKNKIR